MAHANRFGRHLTVVDTPGLFDTKMPTNDVIIEIGKCHAMTSPGLHAILFVIEVGRITEEEQKAIEVFLDYFGNGVHDYVVVVFTGKKYLDDENIGIDEFVKHRIESASLKLFLNRINNRYIALGLGNQDKELKNLLRVVDSVVERNNGKFYTNEMFQAAMKREQERKDEEKRKIREQEERELQNRKREEQEKHELEMRRIKQQMEEEEMEFKWKSEELNSRHGKDKYHHPKKHHKNKHHGCHHKNHHHHHHHNQNHHPPPPPKHHHYNHKHHHHNHKFHHHYHH